jgi:hypothetical protein
MNDPLYPGEVFAGSVRRPEVKLRGPVEVLGSATNAKVAKQWL